jgi:16S rRNA (adenine1518-N6/adenine1519-N6)-dimethyltransferase
MASNALLGPRKLRELLERHGVRPKKQLGQNFVVDPNTIRKIVALAEISAEDDVLEIGAGGGSLTLELARAARKVMAVEFDRGLIPILEEVVTAPNVEIVHADALKMNLSGVGANAMVGNLPYNIAVPVVLRTLTEAPQITRLIVMTQKEVGERLAASPGSKSYGQASVLAQYRARAIVLSGVSRRAFYPVPNVDSVIVRLFRKEKPLAVDEDRFTTVVKAAFAQRRKMLRNTLAGVAGSPENAARVLETVGIEGRTRAEDVGIDDFVALTRELS